MSGDPSVLSAPLTHPMVVDGCVTPAGSVVEIPRWYISLWLRMRRGRSVRARGKSRRE